MKMKKLLILAIGIIPLKGISQDDIAFDVFQENASFISAGYGVGNFTQSLFKVADDNANDVNFQTSMVGPLFLKYEYAFADKVGFGVNFAYVQATADYFYKDQYITDGSKLLEEHLDWKSYSILARVNWHFGNNEKVDPYFGLGMGYRSASWTGSNNDPQADFNSATIENPFNFGFETTLGCRFMFSDNFGAYVEAGLSKAVFQFGLTAKF